VGSAEAVRVTPTGVTLESWAAAYAARPGLELLAEWPAGPLHRTLCCYGVSQRDGPGVLVFWDANSYINAAEAWFVAEMHGTLVPLVEAERLRLQVVQSPTTEYSMQLRLLGAG
jgi:hypothetical protein